MCLLPIPVDWLSLFISLRFAKHGPLKYRGDGGAPECMLESLGGELGREPTFLEVEDLVASKRPQIITAQDVMAAYHCGDEVRWHIFDSKFQVPTNIA